LDKSFFYGKINFDAQVFHLAEEEKVIYAENQVPYEYQEQEQEYDQIEPQLEIPQNSLDQMSIPDVHANYSYNEDQYQNQYGSGMPLNISISQDHQHIIIFQKAISPHTLVTPGRINNKFVFRKRKYVNILNDEEEDYFLISNLPISATSVVDSAFSLTRYLFKF
jgi:hypothetical protein